VWQPQPALAAEPAADSFRYPEKKLAGKAELKYVQDIPVLRVEGTPQEIGEQVGTLAARPAQKICDYPFDYLKRARLDFLWPTLLKEGEKMFQHFPADTQTEIEALVKTSGIERDRVIAGNTMFDLKKMLACSALTVEPERSATRAPLLGRNLDYPSLGYAEQYGLVTIYRPRGKHAFVSVGFPGLVGCLSGMNDAGLAVAVLEIFAVKDPKEKFDSSGIPYAICYRRLLEECTTIDEAEKLLRSMKRTTTTCLAVCDKTSTAVLEISTRHVVRRKPEKGFCVCTNHFCTEQLRPTTPTYLSRSLKRFEILNKVHDLPIDRRLGPAEIHEQLHAVNLGPQTLQTMIFDPANLRLHVALGGAPATAQDLTVLELGPLFKGSGPGK
jgi:predicted choloylglycine hydrolase